MIVPIFQVDAFTSKPFTGNPAAVCLLEQDLPKDTLQAIAAEMNLSETAFVTKLQPSDSFSHSNHFNLRWFTPAVEVPLCGHATLATASAIFNQVGNQASEISFSTLSGTLVAKRDGAFISIDLPLNPCVSDAIDSYRATVDVVAAGLPVKLVEYSASSKKLLVRLEDSVTRGQLEAVRFDFEKLRATDETGKVKGVILTLASDGAPYDFVSRYFAPWVAIPEDPVTGSAHTVLADYWSRVLGKTAFFARQCSPRGGDLKVRLEAATKRVVLAGETALVLAGQLHL